MHDPNVDAVEVLYHKIMPLVWKTLPDLKINIIGSKAPEFILKMNSEKFRIVGYVENIIPYYEKSFASVSPLRFGLMKGKKQFFQYWILFGCTAQKFFGIIWIISEEKPQEPNNLDMHYIRLEGGLQIKHSQNYGKKNW